MPLMVWDMDDLIHNIEKMYADLDDEILKDIARRINKMGFVTSSAELQAQIAVNSGLIYQDILDRVSALTGKTRTELDLAFKKGGVLAVKYDDAIYKAAGLDPISLNLSPAMQQTLVAGLEKTAGVMENLAMSMPNAGQKAYLDAVDSMYMKVSSGAFSYTEALRTGLKEMAAKGLTVVKYTGKTDQIDVAMRRALLTGISQTANRIQIDHAYEMGSDLVEVSAHIGARPSHAVWQGKVYSLSGAGSPKYGNFIIETHYGEGDGLGGWNCRHSFYPFFEGLSDQNYSIKELNDYDRMRLNYNGEDMSFYEGTQKQREIERNIRRWKRQADTLGAGGADNQFELRKVREYQAQMRDFVKQTGLVRQPSREGGSVLRVVNPGFVPPHWVPGMGKPTPISKMSSSGLAKVLPPPPWVNPPAPPAPKKKLVIKPKVKTLDQKKQDLLDALNKKPNLNWREKQIKSALQAHLADPNYYRLIAIIDPNTNEIGAVLQYREELDYLVIDKFAGMKPGMGYDTDALHQLFEEALRKDLGITMQLGSGKVNIEFIALKQYFEDLDIDVVGFKIDIDKTNIATQWENTFGHGDLVKFLKANPNIVVPPNIKMPPVAGPVGIPAPAAPPQPQQGQLLYNPQEAQDIQDKKNKFWADFDKLAQAGNLPDFDDQEMYAALESERNGLTKTFIHLDKQDNLVSLVEYYDYPDRLSIKRVAGYGPLHRRDALKALWEEALLEAKKIEGIGNIAAERNFYKGLGLKLDKLGRFAIEANEVKDYYTNIFGANQWMGFQIRFPQFVPLPPPAPIPQPIQNFTNLPQHLYSIQDGQRFVSKDGKTIIKGTSKSIGDGMYEKAVVQIEGDGEGLMKANYDPQSHLGNGDSGYRLTEGFANREVGAYELDKLMGLGVTPETVLFESTDGRLFSIQKYVDGKSWDKLENKGLKFTTEILGSPNGREEAGRLVLLDLIQANKDRHNGNWMWDVKTKKLWLIDNGLSFIDFNDAAYQWVDSKFASPFWGHQSDLYNAAGKIAIDPKFRKRLREIIDDGSLEDALIRIIKSDLPVKDRDVLKAALKRAEEIYNDWDKYFTLP